MLVVSLLERFSRVDQDSLLVFLSSPILKNLHAKVSSFGGGGFSIDHLGIEPSTSVALPTEQMIL